MTMNTYFHLVLRLRMQRTIATITHTPPWHVPYLMGTKSVTYVPNSAKLDVNILHASVMLWGKMSVAYIR
jgi:hypothetical protein